MRHYILVIMLAVCAAVSAQNDRQLIREGNRLYRQKQYAQAEVLYRKAIAKKADNPQAVYNLGCALMMQQKDSAAIVQYENATKLEKNKLRQSKSWHNIGVMCQSHKMYGEAVNLALCKQLNKNNPQQDKNQQDKKNEEKEDDKGQQQKKDKKDQQKEEQPKEQMSKDNAERLLDAAVQNEKATQQRLKKAMQQPRKKQLQKNW